MLNRKSATSSPVMTLPHQASTLRSVISGRVHKPRNKVT